MSSVKISVLLVWFVIVNLGNVWPGSMEVTNKAVFSQLRAIQEHGNVYNSTVFSVVRFGAKGDGVTDDTKAFEAAWKATCGQSSSVLHVPPKLRFLVGPLLFAGSCQPNIIMKIDGTILAPMEVRAWGSSKQSQWIMFSQLDGITVLGNGLVNGQGASWWKDPSVKRPTAIRFSGSHNVNVQGIAIHNSPQFHIEFTNCTSVKVDNITISSPADSPNTDGIHLQNSRAVEISNSLIGCGDDCVSLQTGCSDIYVHNINCGPGHGISIGGLGKDDTKACVSNVKVEDSNIHNASNGVRIKTWQGGIGSVRGISFSNIKVSNVKYPIKINQYYCDKEICRNQSSAVAISDVTYENITGSYLNTAVRLACSEHVPCTAIRLMNIQLRPVDAGSHDPVFCSDAYGVTKQPIVPPVTCLGTGIPVPPPSKYC